ncbi:aromatic ring-opening dioxygenase LigA [Streptomyces albus subsp. albus]|nr:aromatic ring-opening dioxygenase LigA [Streptomyces albus subsp. albus]
MPHASPPATPRVSVIVAAYNAMPELTRCITSALEQTLGGERIEVIAVDDGSTDDTGAELDRLAATAPALRVVHQQNSGGAGGPRNTGLDLARGDFVFFLDADDYLAPDALRRLVAMADENGTDVVLGRMASPDGRGVPRAVFEHNQPRTDVYSSHAYSTLGAWKLFRRSLIERLELRFPPCRNGEDKPFTAAAMLNAAGISVVADYDCYYIAYRADRSNLTLTAAGLGDRVDAIRLLMETAARYTEPGPRRDQIMHRHFQWELCGALRALPREPERDVRERYWPEFRSWARQWCGEGLFLRLDAPSRLLIHLLRADRLPELLAVVRDEKADAGRGRLVDKGRVYWQHPFFRDPAAAVPDVCFDVTERLPVHRHLSALHWRGDRLRLRGHARIDGVAPLDPRTELVLRLRDADRPELRLPVAVFSDPDLPEGQAAAGFLLDLDPATADHGRPLAPGIWDVYLDVRAQGVSRTVRYGRHRTNGRVTRAPQRLLPAGDGRLTAVSPYFTKPYGNLSLSVGPAPSRLDAPCRDIEVFTHPGDPATWVVRGRLDPGPAADRWPLLLRAEEAATGTVHEAPVRYAADAPFTALLRLKPLPPGRWAVTLETRGPDGTRRTAPLPAPAGLTGARWFRRGRPFYAKPLPAGDTGALTLRIAPIDLGTALRRRLAPVRRRARW